MTEGILERTLRELESRARELPPEVHAAGDPRADIAYRAPVPLNLLTMTTRENAPSFTATTVELCEGTRRDVRHPDGYGVLHRHDYIELVYVLAGVYRIRTETGPLEFGTHRLCLMDRAIRHQEVYRGSRFRALFVCMRADFLDPGLLRRMEGDREQRLLAFVSAALQTSHSGRGYLTLQPPQDIGAVERCLSGIVREAAGRESGSEYICKGLLLRLFDMLTPEIYHAVDAENRREVQSRLFSRVLLYLDEHPDDASPETLSAVFHFQKDYFNRLVRRFSGTSLTELLQRVRLTRAAALLRETDLPVTEIAETVGYRNMGHFYRLFRAAYGTTPAGYRTDRGRRR